jgi:ABC-type uncharacterized transport system YnjBCD permease subunit
MQEFNHFLHMLLDITLTLMLMIPLLVTSLTKAFSLKIGTSVANNLPCMWIYVGQHDTSTAQGVDGLAVP